MKIFTKLFTGVLLIMCLHSSAQEYKTGLGIRGGWITPGFTVKHFISESRAIEGILASHWHGFSLTGLYEIHKDNALGIAEMDWYYGLGAHIANYNGVYYNYHKNGTYYVGETGNVTAIGMNAILGLEYRFQEIPFTLSFDVMPYFDFVYGNSGFLDFALSFRYVF